MYRSGLVDTLVTLANMKGLGRTPLLGDRRGFMPPQLKANKHDQISEKNTSLAGARTHKSIALVKGKNSKCTFLIMNTF
jgi:hypothetical protein